MKRKEFETFLLNNLSEKEILYEDNLNKIQSK